ncbi:MAG: hypothetical protein ACRCZL_03475, partial [Cetobacterium sp.]
DELLALLLYRQEQEKKEEIKKETSFLRKWIFNRYTFFDLKTAVLRESTKLIFTIYILNKFFSK